MSRIAIPLQSPPTNEHKGPLVQSTLRISGLVMTVSQVEGPLRTHRSCHHQADPDIIRVKTLGFSSATENLPSSQAMGHLSFSRENSVLGERSGVRSSRRIRQMILDNRVLGYRQCQGRSSSEKLVQISLHTSRSHSPCDTSAMP